MESTEAPPARERSASLAAKSKSERPLSQGAAQPGPAEKKPVGYGLPCSRCHAYYPADQRTCPICNSAERVTPDDSPAIASAATLADPESALVAGTSIGQERERLLKELKSQAFASHTQISASTSNSTEINNSPETFSCVLKHRHNESAETAAVCHTCYGAAVQKADRMEAALHMDPKDAAEIVYTAVWADTSDPTATYLNAAKALLAELHKRAGISLLAGTKQPLAH